MNTLTIIIAQINGTALIQILLLLLGAAIIGYFTSYFYYRAIYTKIIEKGEFERIELQKQMDLMTQKISDLEAQINEKISEINQLKE